ncbi:MAG: hypothetical protein V3U84_04660, partial [Thiotrichaceae bacterium]
LFNFLRQEAGYFKQRLFHPVILASIGPSFLAILYFMHFSFRVRLFGLLSVVLLGAISCPLAMHAVASDTARISSYAIGGGFIASWILAETKKPRATGDLFALIALPALVLNIFGRIPLMDGEVERFSGVERLLLYSPAIILALSTSVKKNVLRFLPSFMAKGIPNKPDAGDC